MQQLVLAADATTPVFAIIYMDSTSVYMNKFVNGQQVLVCKVVKIYGHATITLLATPIARNTMHLKTFEQVVFTDTVT